MKPTLDSIRQAGDSVYRIRSNIADAERLLNQASTAWELDAETTTTRKLQEAREYLIKLRRSQTAAIDNIDDALRSIVMNKGPK